MPNGFDVIGSADEAVDDEREHGAEGMADGFGVAGVGEAKQGVAQGAQLGAFQRTAGSGGVAIGDGCLMGGRQETGAGEQGCCVFFKGRIQRCLGFSRS